MDKTEDQYFDYDNNTKEQYFPFSGTFTVGKLKKVLENFNDDDRIIMFYHDGPFSLHTCVPSKLSKIDEYGKYQQVLRLGFSAF